MTSFFFVIGLALIGLVAADGLFEVTVTEEETHSGHKTHHGAEKYAECFLPLVQMYHQQIRNYLHTISVEDVIDQYQRFGYEHRGYLGRVMTKKEGCECGDGTELIPAYLLSKPGVYDYMIATNPADIAQFKKDGYIEKRLDFYCSPEANKCGATLPLYRSISPAGEPFTAFCSTNENQIGGLRKGNWKIDTLCYVWPRQFNTHNYIGVN